MRVAIGIDVEVPSELLRDTLTLGKALAARGHAVSYIAGEPLAFADYAGDGSPTELYQAPLPRPAPPLVMKRKPPDGLSDQLAVVGFDDIGTLRALSAIWSRLLESLKPDVIIGCYSPVLWLVAPAHAPTFAFGNGVVLPPISGSSFPRLSAESSPLADEEKMLANANSVLAGLGQPPFSALSDLLGRCHQVLYGISAFDPYLQRRKLTSRGLLHDAPNPTVPPPTERLAVFLDIYCPGIESIVLAIAGTTKVKFDVFIAGVTTGIRRFLEQHPNVTMWSDFAALLDHAGNATAVVHHGVQDVGQRCLTLGRPQLLIPWTREQQMFETVASGMGGTWTKAPHASVDEISGTFRAFLKDASLMVGAQHQAHELAKSDVADALPAILDDIEAAGRQGISRRDTIVSRPASI